MKKEIIVCDLCSKDEDLNNMNEATSVCEFCKKDICEDCSYPLQFGDIEEDEGLIELLCCVDCSTKISLDIKTDGKFIKELKEKLKGYMTRKIVVENLNEKSS